MTATSSTAHLSQIVFTEVSEASPGMLDAVNRLLTQLNATAAPMTMDALDALTDDPSTHLWMAHEGGEWLAMYTLTTYRTPSGRKTWLEDVVVDRAVRGRGLGRQLLAHAVGQARRLGGTLMLTSRPSRTAANRLYQSAGLERKETNVYRMQM